MTDPNPIQAPQNETDTALEGPLLPRRAHTERLFSHTLRLWAAILGLICALLFVLYAYESQMPQPGGGALLIPVEDPEAYDQAIAQALARNGEKPSEGTNLVLSGDDMIDLLKPWFDKETNLDELRDLLPFSAIVSAPFETQAPQSDAVETAPIISTLKISGVILLIALTLGLGAYAAYSLKKIVEIMVLSYCKIVRNYGELGMNDRQMIETIHLHSTRVVFRAIAEGGAIACLLLSVANVALALAPSDLPPLAQTTAASDLFRRWLTSFAIVAGIELSLFFYVVASARRLARRHLFALA